jgi:serine/threonine-protein kinase
LQADPELAGEVAECLQGLQAMEELREALGSAGGRLPLGPQQLGDFKLLREVGRGGMGVVYEARQVRLGRRVALKMLKAGDLAGPEERRRFLAEARAVACLQHPHIVQVFEVGELAVGAGPPCPYIALEFVDGSSLEAVLAQAPLPAPQVARLGEPLARAVHHAHTQGIVHRDLKPANILLHKQSDPQMTQMAQINAEDKTKPLLSSPSVPSVSSVDRFLPKITDFGLAKRLDGLPGQTRSGAIVGTPSYMAPEQASGKGKEVGPAADVYALGAILYECLTGRPPFKAATLLDTLAQVVAEEPVPPRRLQPKVPRDLETIVLKCLHKEPGRRYASALALAEDLRRWSSGEPIEARPAGRLERLGRWCRHNPAATLVVGTAAALLLAVTVTALSVARARAARLQEEALQGNLYAAQGVASTVLWHLEQLSGPVVKTAEDPRLRALLEKGDGPGLQRFFEEVHRTYAAPGGGYVQGDGEPSFQSWHVLDRDGKLLADSGPNQDVLGWNFSGRDYFQGALRHRGERGRSSVHISRVYHSRNDNLSKFAITAPVHGPRGPGGPVRGVVAATFTTTATLGSLRLNDARRTAVLVGRRDTSPFNAPAAVDAPAEYLVLLHPLYHRGEEAVAAPAARLRAIHQPSPGDVFRLPEPGLPPGQAVDAAYQDPLLARRGSPGNRWLAGFAPVGNTEFVVIVQQRADEVLEPDRDLVRDLVLWGGVAPLGTVLLLALGWYGVRQVRGRSEPATKV